MRKTVFLILLLAVGCTGSATEKPGNVERIVSLAPAITETLFAIDAGEKVVGVTSYCDYPENVLNLPKVGDFIRPDFEKIVALKPGLVIATTDSSAREAITKLQSLSLKTLAVNSKSFKDMVNSVLVIGRAAGRLKKARQLAADLITQRDVIAARHSKAERPSTLLLYGIEPLVAAGEGSLGNELIDYAGGRNVFADSGNIYVTTGFEKIISLAPEVIVQVAMGTESNHEALKYWAKWTSIPAVKNGRIYILDPDLLTRPGPRIIQGLKLLEQALHGKTEDSK